MEDKYQLTDIVVDKDIDESFKCGICMGILNTPILCVGGHSWCFDCIKFNNLKKCPICPKPIDHNNPQPNFSLKSLIGKISCKCPNGVGNLIVEKENNNNKKRKSNSSGCFSIENTEEDFSEAFRHKCLLSRSIRPARSADCTRRINLSSALCITNIG
jgi:hypothetical protein